MLFRPARRASLAPAVASSAPRDRARRMPCGRPDLSCRRASLKRRTPSAGCAARRRWRRAVGRRDREYGPARVPCARVSTTTAPWSRTAPSTTSTPPRATASPCRYWRSGVPQGCPPACRRWRSGAPARTTSPEQKSRSAATSSRKSNRRRCCAICGRSWPTRLVGAPATVTRTAPLRVHSLTGRPGQVVREPPEPRGGPVASGWAATQSDPGRDRDTRRSVPRGAALTDMRCLGIQARRAVNLRKPRRGQRARRLCRSSRPRSSLWPLPRRTRSDA